MSRKNKKLLRCRDCRTLTPGGGLCDICWQKRFVAAADDIAKRRAQLARLRDESKEK